MIRHLLRYYFLFLLFSTSSFSQEYQWQWAKNGGGSYPTINESSGFNTNIEYVQDILVDSDNNYYFLSNISSGTSRIDGIPITTYDMVPGQYMGRDILISSFECDGTYRWSRVIGGSGISPDYAYKLVLDNSGGIYLNVIVINNTSPTSSNIPPHFSEENSLPYLTGDSQQEQEGYRAAFLLKYDTNTGDLIWRKDLQGDVNLHNRGVMVSDLIIDSNNILHSIVGFKSGTHLDGILTVPETNNLKYYLLKFNTNGELINTPHLLPIEGLLLQDKTSFRYDENINRYYIAGWNRSSVDVTFNGVSLIADYNHLSSFAFFISFNPDDLQDWWYKDFTAVSGWLGAELCDIEIDNNSDIYICGKFFNPSNAPGINFGEHIFSNSITGNVPYILKMNSQGEVKWSKIPTGFTLSVASTGSYYGLDVAINGTEVALATHGGHIIWEDFYVNRPAGHRTDPILVRFDKNTGGVIGLHDIYGTGGIDHYLTAVTADINSNYVVGGAMRGAMFQNNPNNIPTLYTQGQSDFFFARLAATECGVDVEQLSDKNISLLAMNIYPNPVKDKLYIESEVVISYVLYNNIGQQISSGTFENSVNEISFEGLTSGIYFLRFMGKNNKSVFKKIIKSP